MIKQLVQNAKIGVFTLGQVFAADINRPVWVIVTAFDDNEVVVTAMDYQPKDSQSEITTYAWTKNGQILDVEDRHEDLIDQIYRRLERLHEVVELQNFHRNQN